MSYNPLPPAGQTTQAASLPVVLPSDGLGAVTSKPLYSSPIGTSQVAGTVTTVPSGTTVVSGTVSTTITGTTTIAGNVTSTITGTTAVNLYQVSGVAITLGQAVSASSMPVALASDGIGSSTSKPIYTSPVGTTAISGTVTTAASGTTTISGNVTSTPTGTTVVTGTTAISGTVTTAVTNTVTSTITGTVTSAVNLYQVNGVALNLGSTTQSASVPVVLPNTNTVINITTSTGVAGITNYAMGTLGVQITSVGTGGVVVFEGSNDNANWAALTGQFMGDGVAYTGASAAGAWQFDVSGVNYFRVRATALTSGSIAGAMYLSISASVVTLDNATTVKGTQPGNMVATQDAKDSGRIYKVFYFDNIAGITSEALATTTINSGGTITTGTSYSVTAGKTLRITAISGTIKDASSTAVYGRIRVRSAATVNATSGIIAALDIATQLGTGLAGGGMNVNYDIPDGIEIAAAQQIGITHIENSATSSTSVIVTGFEY
jgi:hypothetical protein